MAGEDDIPGEDPETEPPAAGNEMTRAGPVPEGERTSASGQANRSSAAWGRLVLDLSGEAGDWFVGYQPFPAPRTELQYQYSLSVRNEGGRLFVMPLSFPASDGDSTVLVGSAFFATGIRQDGSCGIEEGGSTSMSMPDSLHGLFLAVASATPWTLEFTFDLGAGQTLNMTTFNYAGSGAAFHQGTHLLTQQSPAVGQTTLSMAVASGWHHVQAVYDRFQPTQARAFDATFPGHEPISHVGSQTGYWALGGTASGSMVDMAGIIQGAAGEVTLSITYAAGNLGMTAEGVSIPLAAPDLPAFADAVYVDDVWPFPDGIPDSCPIV